MHVRDWAVSIIEKLHKLARVRPHIHIDRDRFFGAPANFFLLFLEWYYPYIMIQYCTVSVSYHIIRKEGNIFGHMLYTTLVSYVLTA